nr:MAG TPA: hypothetical protein [Caudoviricetes sp.]
MVRIIKRRVGFCYGYYRLLAFKMQQKHLYNHGIQSWHQSTKRDIQNMMFTGAWHYFRSYC